MTNKPEITHEMKLQPEPFNKIKDGSKVIESRLFDEKRREIKLGDKISFLKNPELEESVETEVVGLLHYPSFELLMSQMPPEIFGGKSKEALLQEIHQFYSDEDELEYGVLGIHLKIIS